MALEESNSALKSNEEYLNDLVNEEMIDLFDEHNCFTDLTMEVAINLDSYDIAYANIGLAMRDLLRLAGKNNRIPCPTTVANLFVI